MQGKDCRGLDRKTRVKEEEKMADDGLDEVTSMLQECTLDQMLQVCQTLEIEVAEEKRGRRLSVFNIIIRHLASEEVENAADSGEDLFRRASAELHRIIDIDRPVIEDQNVPPAEEDPVAEHIKTEPRSERGTERGMKTKIELTKLREFKIVGGTIGSEGGLEYMSLSYQIQEGKAIGYSQKEILAGVIKAIKGGSSLRRYLEGRPNITEENFMKILRAHYNVKDSTTLFNEMANAAQETTESELNYVLRMMSLRDNVLTLSKEEACPFEENLVRRRFFHSLSVGFRKDTIRLEAQNLLRDRTMSDEVLMKEMSDLVAREGEHVKKIKGKTAAVGMIGVEEGKENKILKELGNLTESLAMMKEEMLEIRKKVNDGAPIGETSNAMGRGGFGSSSRFDRRGSRGGYRGRGGSRYPGFIGKCEECQKTNAFCEHCTVCGDSTHKRKDCPKNL